MAGITQGLRAVNSNGASSNTTAGRSNQTAMIEASPPPRLWPVNVMFAPYCCLAVRYASAASVVCVELSPMPFLTLANLWSLVRFLMYSET